MGNNWSGYILVFAVAAIVMARLDRLGRQIEAVSAHIRADVARTEEERKEILSEWQEAQKDAAKDARHFWIFWGIVGVAALIWAAVKSVRPLQDRTQLAPRSTGQRPDVQPD